MGENKNQEVLQDAIMKALDDAELENIDGGKSEVRKTIVTVAATVALTLIGVQVVDHYAPIGSGIKKDIDKGLAPLKKKLQSLDPGSKEALALKDQINSLELLAQGAYKACAELNREINNQKN